MSADFSDSYSANLIALWDFLDGSKSKDTGLDDGIAQNGVFKGDAKATDGRLVLDGHGEWFEVDGDNGSFDLDAGTIIVQFTQDAQVGSSPDTLVSRGEYKDRDDEGFLDIRVTDDGEVEVFHSTGSTNASLSTDKHVFKPGDVVEVFYGWDATQGATLRVVNKTQNTEELVSNDTTGLTLDIGDQDDEDLVIGAREQNDGGPFDRFFDGKIDYVAIYYADVTSQPDGIVDGTSEDDTIDLAYLGDPEGDRIDNNDAILPGEAPQDDIVDAGAGDDKIKSEQGNDEVYAGSGDDTVKGGIGNDLIFGDANYDPDAATITRESFEWDLAPDPDNGGPIDDGDDLSAGFTQNTGSVDVNFSVLSASNGVDNEFADNKQFVDGITSDGAPVDNKSSFESVLNGNNKSADYQFAFSQDVQNVSFRINDLDGDGIVQVQAFDAEGVAVEVTLTAGSDVDLSDEDTVAGDETATATGPYRDDDHAQHSVLVEIAGPLSKITIAHEQDGHDNTGINFTDVYFDVETPFDNGAPGNDSLLGQEGVDTLFGEEGHDYIDGGIGDDQADGGDGDDTVKGGEGVDALTGGDGDDTVSGGDQDDLVLGGIGNDDLSGDDGNDILGGGDGDDTATGGAGIDVVFGGEGEDRLIGGADSDLLAGGDDNDKLFGDGVEGEGNLPDGGFDVLLGGDGDDTLVGGTGNDLLVGGAGADEQFGGADADTFLNVTIGDVIDGNETGQDNDTIIVSDPAVVTYDPSDPEAGTIEFIDPVSGNVIGTASFENIENVIIQPFAAAGGIAPVSGTSTNGTTGGQTPVLSQAAQAVLGGSDVPPYAAGDGIVDGTDLGDTIDLAYVDGDGDQIDNNDAILPGEAPNDDIVLAGDGNDSVSSFDGDDEVYLEDGDDTAFGGIGNDEILGGDGDDDIFGEAVNDVLAGGDGADEIRGGANNGQIGGGDGDDELFGDDGDDILFGNADNDIIEGGTGADLLSGGTGQDQIDLGSDDNIDLAFGGDDQDTFTGIGANDRVDGGEGGIDEDTLDLTGAAQTANAGGSLQVEYDPNNSENGVVRFFDANRAETGTMEFFNIENVVPCFTPGTLIATPYGEKPVDELQVGDRVITRDNGIHEICWLGKSRLNRADMMRAKHLAPIVVRAGALGNGLPERDMVLSPNHRLLVSNDKTALYFEEREVLVSAKHLVGLDGVEPISLPEVTYVHFMFEQHEVVLSDGTWTESFQPGDQSLAGIGNAQRTEIFELFPELQTAEGLANYHSARRSLKKHEAKVLLH